ncbi:hypothetical protein [Actinomadura kijaniata]|uniref:hypothetical protein n=1 Tax=Actinomadura kijaniata TaxID=46161 RepID=UPI0008320132|nr:hypothetical protein [Actinomadura kijaniata]
MPGSRARPPHPEERGRLARLLLVALGLLGFMVVPAAGATAPAASGVRVGPAQAGAGNAARVRSSRPRAHHHRADHHRAEFTVAVLRHLVAAPCCGQDQATPPPATDPRPDRAVRLAAADRPGAVRSVARVPSRSRAPPASHRI